MGILIRLRHFWPGGPQLKPTAMSVIDRSLQKIIPEKIKTEARTKGVPNRFSYHQFDHLTS
ncbi:MAG: hypothetical protein CM1200mP18_16970 [Gammaproteobacteria bacterium]|nr:MAG: hypothetical protein CM1200mP18_16970 [Gammaproteobacteria bacterium]